MNSTLAIGAAFTAAVIIRSVCAADELMKHQLPKRVDLTGSGQTKVIVAQIEIAPGRLPISLKRWTNHSLPARQGSWWIYCTGYDIDQSDYHSLRR